MKTPLGGCRGEFVLVVFRNDVFFFVKYDVITGGNDVFFGEEYYFKFRVGEFFLFHCILPQILLYCADEATSSTASAVPLPPLGKADYFAAYATAAV